MCKLSHVVSPNGPNVLQITVFINFGLTVWASKVWAETVSENRHLGKKKGQRKTAFPVLRLSGRRDRPPLVMQRRR
jgi:hypothetical protein